MKAKVAIACSGLGHIKRGLESFTEDLFRQLQRTDDFQTFLFRGTKTGAAHEHRVRHLPRHTLLARLMAFILRRHPYYVQNFTFALGMTGYLLREKPQVIYVGEPVLYRFLQLWRERSRQKFKMIFFTGGQTIPAPFHHSDILHHVTPELLSKAKLQGIAERNQYVIPHFINVQSELPLPDTRQRKLLRQQLGLPEQKFIILSVGAIDFSVKRMNYLIDEVSRLNHSNHFLLMLGENEKETKQVISYAKQKLGAGSYKISTVNRQQLNKYYQAADHFVLASLKEGFGLAYVEALSFGLPVLAHDYDTARFVLKDYGYFGDFTQPDTLANLMAIATVHESDIVKQQRREFVCKNYTWETLKDDYLKMFRQAIYTI